MTINTEYFDNLETQIDNITTCSDLASRKAEIEAYFLTIGDDITAQLAELLPLISIPGADLGEIVGYITNLVAIYTKPYNNLIIIQAEYIAKAAEISATITDKENELQCVI